MSDPAAHYTVLARRFRPQTFADVVGQDRIGQAICNAILSGRVAHAYLFTGARGVGKTSTARIFAKALNCPHVKDAVPCNDCEVCDSISAGSDVDVLEIDGASNRGIDDIRSLRANVSVRSMRSPYKVYIIDEVHMLTKEAFNALLKTLEEPPPNVKFVFCTTEPNKVPDTILSRCQRFDFGTIAASSIVSRLAQIAVAEKVDVAEEALELIARRAAGSMRDSQSLFDQLLAFGSDRIGVDDVHQLLGTAGDDRLIGLVDAIIGRRRDEVLDTLDTAMQEGVQVGAFSDQLLHYLRDLLIIAAGAESVALESVSESLRPRLAEQANAWGLRTITAALEVLANTKSRMQRVNYDRALMELAVIRLSLLEDLDRIGDLIGAVANGSGGVSSPRPSPTGRSSSPTPPTSASLPAKILPVETTPTTVVTSPPSQVVTETPPPPVDDVNDTTDARTKPTASNLESVPVTYPVAVESAPKPVELTAETLDAYWSQVLDSIPDRLAEHLGKADGIAISGPNSLELSFPSSYVLSRQFCERPEARSRVVEKASEIAGTPIEITMVASQEVVPPTRSDSSSAPSSEPTRRPAARITKSDAEQDPFVQKALDIFGGTVIDVREIHETASEGT